MDFVVGRLGGSDTRLIARATGFHQGDRSLHLAHRVQIAVVGGLEATVLKTVQNGALLGRIAIGEEEAADTLGHRRVDVATNNDVGLLFTERQNPRAFANIRVIWESPPIPESAIVVRGDVDPAVTERIRSFFMTYGDTPEERAVLDDLEYGGFQAADDNYLDPVREMEASVALMEARRSGDAARIAAAQTTYDEIHARVAAAEEVQP